MIASYSPFSTGTGKRRNFFDLLPTYFSGCSGLGLPLPLTVSGLLLWNTQKASKEDVWKRKGAHPVIRVLKIIHCFVLLLKVLCLKFLLLHQYYYPWHISKYTVPWGLRNWPLFIKSHYKYITILSWTFLCVIILITILTPRCNSNDLLYFLNSPSCILYCLPNCLLAGPLSVCCNKLSSTQWCKMTAILWCSCILDQNFGKNLLGKVYLCCMLITASAEK